MFGNKGLQGQPVLPYTDFISYAGVDVFVQLTFLDRNDALVVPVSLSWRLDDLTNGIGMVPWTSVPVTGSTQELQIPSTALVMNKQTQGSQLCQLALTATLSDGTVANQVGVIELAAIQFPTT